MDVEHVYYSEFCPQCEARACVTQSVGYSDWRVCPDAAQGDDKCRAIGCCHGCQCQRDDECGAACRCDCHQRSLMLRLREDDAVEVIDLTAEPEPVNAARIKPGERIRVVRFAPTVRGRCQCAACRNPAFRLHEHDVDGVTYSNRPRSCAHFARRNKQMVSTHYDNEDGRNRRLDEFFAARK